jgi:serum/glucocorticoid-regulated kinase 2
MCDVSEPVIRNLDTGESCRLDSFDEHFSPPTGFRNAVTRGATSMLGVMLESLWRSSKPNTEQEAGEPEQDPPSLQDFTMLRVIGKGCFGKIVLARKKDTGEHFAMKVLNKTNVVRKKQVDHTRAERRILSRVDPKECPFIVSLHSAFQTESKLYLVLDYIPGGDLYFHLSQWRRFPEVLARFFIAEVLCALEYLHSVQVAYRDLKPENILLDAAGHVRLVDFGLSKEGVQSPLNGATSLCGTPEYLAPEILNKKGHGTAVDIWAVGMVLYEFLTGLPPWYTRNREKLFRSLRTSPLAIPDYVSVDAVSLLEGLLKRDPAQRIGSKFGIQEVTGHPFFKEIDWQKLKKKEMAPPINPMLHSSAKTVQRHESKLARLPIDSTMCTNGMSNGDLIDVERFEGLFPGFTYAGPTSFLTTRTDDERP